MNTRKNIQRPRLHLAVTACFFAFSMCSSLHLPSRAIAQAPVPSNKGNIEAWWGKLQKADSHIGACRVTWKSVTSIKPQPQTELEQRTAQALAWAQQQGFGEKEAQGHSQMARREAQRDIKGRTIVSLLNCVRVGNTVRCESVYSDLGHRAIDFYDGTNSVFVQTQVKGKEVPKNGNLTRNPKDVLLHSTGGRQVPRFLLGIPLEQEFSSSNPAFSPEDVLVREEANGNTVLERKVILKSAGFEFSDVLTLSKEYLRPTSYEVFDLKYRIKGGQISSEGSSVRVKGGHISAAKGRLMARVEATGYKQYKDGVWFPSKVTVTTSTSTTEYTLVKAAFNGPLS